MGKVGHHQKKFKVLFRNHANFYGMLREALDTEDKETEKSKLWKQHRGFVFFVKENQIPQQHPVLQSCYNSTQ